ncbi:hypothetical protein E3N88_22682 [Mikania micrantha]|uniref:Uncharacterized protein n=1 Tax=Mikania micrantha TaxID=192012 RepID=A0A5N6NB42_9ASTR|nr:hypothetical protein E3N88_22682 [Mikania micrantha]
MRHESKAIKEIVDTILNTLFPLNSKADEDLVGMKTRLQYLKPRLEIGSDGVRMVGIWGVGGGGKTTLANSLYTEISQYFQGHCIVENIREESSKHGLNKLQGNMISALFKKETPIYSVLEGKNMIKNMLRGRKVLLILDDVDKLDQLEALAGKHDWFGSGSRIIITTRNEHLLRTHKVDEVCHVQLLSSDEAMQLFNRHAYNEKVYIGDYETLSSRVVSYAAGLPLALKVLGSFLYDKTKDGWISTLDRLKDIPETAIVEKLKISYDGLKNVEKELFLDIACFFRRSYKARTMEMLEACDFHPEIGIEVLRQKALISIVDGRFDMHDLVQEMGHYIVRGEYPNNPDKHSRIWKRKEIHNMLFEDATMENNKIEAVKYDDYEDGLAAKSNYDASQLCKIVSNIKKLRYLEVRIGDTTNVEVEGPAFLSNELRYFIWEGYPARSPFPDGFQLVKLVVLKLEKSFQKEVWKGCKHLPHLKVLQLCYMKKLIRTPNFDGLPCLQKLTLIHCHELEEIHKSLGNHTSLQYVSVSYCIKLRMFPSITHMKNLKNLEIKVCPKILEFPKIHANMESLVELSIECTEIDVFPSSIGEHCTNLISLQLGSSNNLKSINVNFDALKHLKELQLNTLRHVEIPSSIIELSNLQELTLSFIEFSRLGFSLSQLTQLKYLNVSYCEKLLELPELPSSLTTLLAVGCKSLKTFGDCYKNCRWLCAVSLRGGSIINDGDRLLESMLEASMAIENHYMFLYLKDILMVKGLTPQLVRGNRCRLQLPENWWNEFSGFLMCGVMSRFYVNIFTRISKNEEMNGMDSEHDVFWEETDADAGNYNSWVAYVSFGWLRQTAWWDQTCKALTFETGDDRRWGRCFGVRLIEKKRKSGLTETSTIYSSGHAPYLKIEHHSPSAIKISGFY